MLCLGKLCFMAREIATDAVATIKEGRIELLTNFFAFSPTRGVIILNLEYSAIKEMNVATYIVAMGSAPNLRAT